MNFRTLSLALGLALLGAPVSTFAVHSERVDQNSFEDFSAGEVHGVEVTQDGFLRAGPRLEKWVSFQDAAIWDAIPDGKGGYFVAAGNEGKVYRVDAQGKTSVAFQAKESNVFALALDAKGNLYAGSSPDGRVYRMGGDGKAEAWFEPNQKYIWDLAWRDGKLYVGTGENGILYRVSDKAKGEVFFDSDQKHIRTLFFDSKGRLWTGSDPDGVVFRFEKPESSAVQRVIYKSAFKEVKSFTEDARGNVFVATMGEDKDHPKAATATVKAPAPASPDLAATDEKSAGSAGEALLQSLAENADTVAKAKPAAKTDAGSEVVRITPQDETEYWGGDTTAIHAIAGAGGDDIWIGTADHAKFYRLNSRREFTLVGQLEATEAVKFLNPSGGEKSDLVLASSHPAALWKARSENGKSGTFESAAIDAQTVSRWGRLHWVARGKSVEARTRTGNTDTPDKTWSEWTSVKDGKVQSPPARYLQYELQLGGDAQVDDVRIFYLPFNGRPVLSSVQVNPPGLELTKMSRPDMPPMLPLPGPSDRARKGAGAAADPNDAMSSLAGIPPMMPVRHAGWRSATWQAHDPNNDALTFEVYYRASGESAWKLLQGNVHDTFISWDASGWPDGDYMLKIVASDLDGNPPGEEKTDERLSDVFLVDNTAPTVSGSVSGDSLKFTAQDAASTLKQAEISVDGKDWRPVAPEDGILDEKQETFVFSTKNLGSGEHHAVFRIKDEAENTASVTLRFKR